MIFVCHKIGHVDVLTVYVLVAILRKRYGVELVVLGNYERGNYETLNIRQTRLSISICCELFIRMSSKYNENGESLVYKIRNMNRTQSISFSSHIYPPPNEVIYWGGG